MPDRVADEKLEDFASGRLNDGVRSIKTGVSLTLDNGPGQRHSLKCVARQLRVPSFAAARSRAEVAAATVAARIEKLFKRRANAYLRVALR